MRATIAACLSLLLAGWTGVAYADPAPPVASATPTTPTTPVTSDPSSPSHTPRPDAKVDSGRRGTAFDHRFAGLPAAPRGVGKNLVQAAIEITPGIPARFVTTPGEVLLDKTVTIAQSTSELLAVARSSNGQGAVRVDDVLTVEATRPDGSKVSRTVDFSNGCSGVVTPAGPLYLTGILQTGTNSVRFVLRDGCGVQGSADPMYVVPVTGRVPDGVTLGAGCDACAKNPSVARGYPVNTATGNETKTAVDLQLPGAGSTFKLLRSYNSASDRVGALGRGWNHGFESRLEIAGALQAGTVTYVGVDGQQATFTQNSDGSYTGGLGVEAKLTKLSDGRFQLAQVNGSSARFGTTGLLEQMVDSSGVGLSMSYAAGRLATVTDAAGRVVRFTHDTDGRLTRAELPDGRAVTYGYTGGLLTVVQDVRGGTTSYQYNAAGLLTKATDQLGHSVTNEYDVAGKVIKQTDPRGKVTQFVYDSMLGTVTIRPDGGRWTDHYIGNVLVGTSDPLGGHTSFGYDAKLNLIATTDARGLTTTMTYDSRGNMLTKTAPAPLNTVEKWTYDAADNVLTYVDGRGKTTSFAYDTANRVTKVTHPDLWSNSFTYTATGQLKTRSTGRGYVWTNEYDAAGNLTATTSPLGNKTAMTYDVSGRLTSTIDARGTGAGGMPSAYTTTYAYDAADNVTSTRWSDDSTEQKTYDVAGNMVGVQTTSSGGSVLSQSSFAYDNENRLVQSKNRDRVTQTLSYDDAGNRTSSTDSTGARTTFGYDRLSRVTSMTTARGNVEGANETAFTWRYGYDAVGNRIQEQQPNQGSYRFGYDALNHRVWTQTPLGNRTDMTTDANGNVLTVRDPLGRVTTYTYDSVGRLASEAKPGLQPTRYQSDPDGALITQTSPSGQSITRWTYDADGRQITQVDPRGNVSGGTPSSYTTAYGYDAVGNQITVTDQLGRISRKTFDSRSNVVSERDPRGGTTAYAYDALQRLTSVTSPVGAKTTYAFNDYGDLNSRTNARNSVTQYTYTSRGEVASTVDPLGRKQTFAYDPEGNLTEKISARGYASGDLAAYTVRQTFDALGRRTAVDTASATTNATFAYDLDGKLTTMTDTTGTSTLGYDDASQLTAVGHPSGNYGYTYNSFGAVATRVVPSNAQTSYTYDSEGRAVTMAADGQTTSFGYDVDDNLTTVTYPASSGYVQTRVYDRVGDIAWIRNQKNGSTTPLSRYDYTRDANRNPVVVKRTRGTVVYNEAFEYDAANRLTKNCRTVTTCTGSVGYIGYSYDEVGNKVSDTRVGIANSGVVNYAYDAADQVVTRTDQTGSVYTTSYDADGHMTNGRQWDVLGRMTSETVGGQTTSFSYDASGLRRTAQSSAGTKKISWDVNNPIPVIGVVQRTDGTYWRHRYTPDGWPLYVDHRGSTYARSLFFHDGVHSVMEVTNENGAGKWSYGYEPFGVRMQTTKVAPDALDPQVGFTGAYLESTTNEYTFRARDLIAWGMFVAPDPVAPDLGDPYVSSYVYGDQRPTVMGDPSGQTPEWLNDAWGTAKDAAEGAGRAAYSAVSGSHFSAQEAGRQFAVGSVGGLVDIAESRLDTDYLSDQYYSYAEKQTGVSGHEPLTGISEYFAPIPGGVGIKLCRAGAKLGPRISENISIWLSRRKLGALGDVVKSNKDLDVDAVALSRRLGGRSQVRFSTEPKDFEYDVISDKYVGQTTRTTKAVDQSWRKQAQRTILVAKKTGRTAYFHFDGEPHRDMRRALERYQERYDVRVIIDTRPLR